MSGASYLRCKHCKGFYETAFAQCKWCRYDAPFLDLTGQPRLFPDRESCRALQIAEYEQLPKEAHEDSMGPPPDDLTLLCNCLHCGIDGHTFEAIEMRWIANERMWACPCTTCGGRGFSIDIHSAENKWQCVDCGHFYVPKDNDYHHDNAKCPKCGCEQANGWFDDDYDEEDFEDELGELPPIDPKAALSKEELPWEDSDMEDEPAGDFDLGISWREREDADDPTSGADAMADDIDFPHLREESDIDINEDDIPF
jgi:hypothetical protein